MKIKVKYIIFFIALPFFLLGQTNQNETDLIKIGNQFWTTKNLEVTHFRNGDIIPEAKTTEEWTNAGNNGQPAWCYYENNSANGTVYGKLYNWFAVVDQRGLAPRGWHIPNDEEWKQLTDFLGGEKVAGKKLKSKSYWNKNGNGTDEVGFNGLPGGWRNRVGTFDDMLGGYGGWWSSSEWFLVSPQTTSDRPKPTAWVRYVGCCHPDEPKAFFRGNVNKKYGLSVRCIKD